MVIKSYLAYPIQGKLMELEEALREIAGCEVIPATNRDLLVLVTESQDEKTEEALVASLRDLPALQALALVSGYNE
jgi:nitrate reductase NapAB chaperone NapD